MFFRHRTPEPWHLPTPFRDSAGGRITFPLNRPGLYTIPFLVGLGNVANWLLSEMGLQYHVVVRAVTYIACVLGAIAASELAQRPSHGDRIARACGSTVVMAGCLLVDASPSRDPLLLITIGTVVLLTLLGEAGFQVSRRFHPVGDPEGGR
ncbi:hypothetical protein [Phytohabitans houttuyneae]|uniref:Uncharacterized protein n=1 Tax=Phytohabitans houttuyneae TaxID=1076126 RepID=A0A6V8KSB9_9ACTN|nr:hypothetical protein [Phytohabitans houttuyneae]GFJ85538.1 hypothetical protein Phou_097180 [Phytohabitans houttuyneae]